MRDRARAKKRIRCAKSGVRLAAIRSPSHHLRPPPGNSPLTDPGRMYAGRRGPGFWVLIDRSSPPPPPPETPCLLAAAHPGPDPGRDGGRFRQRSRTDGMKRQVTPGRHGRSVRIMRRAGDGGGRAAVNACLCRRDPRRLHRRGPCPGAPPRRRCTLGTGTESTPRRILRCDLGAV